MSIKWEINKEGVNTLINKLDIFTGLITADCREVSKGIAPVNTGKLRDSIYSDRIDKGEWIYGSDLEYAHYIEFGTRYIQAEPFLRPAIDIVKGQNQ